METKEIDWKKIDEWIEKNKNRRPRMVAVDDSYWNDALDGMRENVSHMDIDSEVNGERWGTHTVWTLIWMGAMEFCRGYEYAEVVHGKREETNYPRM
jgi:hypothetical protein